MNKGTCIATLALLPWLPAHPHGRQVAGEPSARQVQLEAFRTTQGQVRVCKREARAERLAHKRARLQEALDQARDRLQLRLLHELMGDSRAIGAAPGPSLRRGLLGLGGLALLAGASAADGQLEVVAPVRGVPEPPAPAGPADPPPLAETLTNLLMEQLDSDEFEQAGPMVQRALQAQRTLLRNALGSAAAFPLPAAATPAALLLRGVFQSALTDTALGFLGEVLPPEFGPLPARRGAPAADGGEREQAWNALQAAKKEVVAAIREAKGVGSDIVVAATSLLGYGAFASVAYGLDIGAAITGIFTATPVSGAGVATGTLNAVANQFFLMAYASDAIAGSVLVHKLREPYIDALLRVGDAEAAWVAAYEAYMNLNRTSGSGVVAAAPAALPRKGPGKHLPATPAPVTAAPALAAAGDPPPPDQASAAAPRARPLRLGW